jgi:sugar lactone lactonase YvrE
MTNYAKAFSVGVFLGLTSLSFAQTTTAPIYDVSVVAGIPTGAGLGDGGPYTNGIVSQPQGIAVDTGGNIYVADNNNNRIRKIDVATGIISTFASSNLNGPNGITFDSKGNLWVAQSGDHRTLRISPDGKTSTRMTYNGTTNTFGGDGQFAVDAYFNSPGGVAVDDAGNVYIADTSNNRVRVIKNENNCINTPVALFGVSKTHSCRIYTIAGGGPTPSTGQSCSTPTNVTTTPNGTTNTVCTADGTRAVGTNTVGDNGPALLAKLNGPFSVAVEPDGSILYISDTAEHRIRSIDMRTGLIKTLIGNCTAGTDPVVVPCPSGSFGNATSSTSGNGNGTGTLGDGKLAVNATTSSPRGLYLDHAHNLLYFADSGNNRIRVINLNTGIVTTVVGSGSGTSSADQANSLNSSLLTSIGIDTPYAVAVQNGLIYFAEQGSDKVRVADPASQRVRTLVRTPKSTGSGRPATEALLGFATTLASTASPRVAVDRDGNLYIVEASTHKIRKVGSDGIIVDWAGTGASGNTGDTGLATAARLSSPQSLAFDSQGNGYIADTGNSRIRKVDTKGIITTVVGRSQVTSCNAVTTKAGQCFIDKSNYVGDGGDPLKAILSGPQGIDVDALDNLVIADTGHHAIRYVDFNANTIVTIAGGVSAGNPDGPIDGRSGLATSGYFDSTNALYGLLAAPRGIAVDRRNGHIYITEWTNSATRELAPINLGKYSLFTPYGSASNSGGTPGIPTGTGAATVPATLRISSSNATSVAVDPGGNVYYALAAQDKVHVMTADHTRLYIVAGGGSNDSGLNYTTGNSTNIQTPSATGVAVDSKGVVYIADRTGVVKKLVCTKNCLPLE